MRGSGIPSYEEKRTVPDNTLSRAEEVPRIPTHGVVERWFAAIKRCPSSQMLPNRSLSYQAAKYHHRQRMAKQKQ